MWERLRIYLLPYRGASVACAAAGMGTDTMANVRIGDVAADGSHVLHDGQRWDFEDGSHAFVRAQVNLARLLGYTDTDALMCTPRRGALSPRYLGTAVSEARRDTGLAVTAVKTPQRDLDELRWRRNWAVALEPLEGAFARPKR